MDEQDNEQDDELERDRYANDQRLKSRFENIFAKYARDFSGIGDEIDMETGEIVVDNGHLANMQHEADPGDGESTQLLNDFRLTLEHEDEADGTDTSELTELEDSGSEDEAASSNTSISGGDSTGNPPKASQHSHNVPIDPALLQTSVLTSASDLTTAATRQDAAEGELVRDDAGHSVTQPQVMTSAVFNQHTTAVDVVSMPGVKESLLLLRRTSAAEVDPDRIHALGMSIANQIARFIGGGSESKSEPTSKSKRSEPAWDYPELPAFKRRNTERARPSLPQLTNLISSPVNTKKGEPKESVWAPLRHPRHSKRKPGIREKGFADAVANDVSRLPALASLEVTTGPAHNDEVGNLKKCTNCSIAATVAWRRGPDGPGSLCNCCGMYYYRYGLMKPLRPPTPEPDSADEDGDVADGRSGRRRKAGTRHVRFSAQEDALIIKLKEVDKLSWEMLGRYFIGRSIYGVQCRYSKKLLGECDGRDALIEQGFVLDGFDATGPEAAFTEEQDELLMRLRENDKAEWDVIAASVPGKTARNIEARYKILMGIQPDPAELRRRKRANPVYAKDKAPKNHGRPFTAEEDELLIRLREIDKLPWEILAQEFNGRTWLSLQKRYVRTLAQRQKVMKAGGDDPYMHLFLEADNDSDDILMGHAGRKRIDEMLKQRREEDDILLHLKDEEGLTFEQIAEEMPGRTVVSLENRYKALKDTDDSMDVPQPTSPGVRDALAAQSQDEDPVTAECNSPIQEAEHRPGDVANIAHDDQGRLDSGTLTPGIMEDERVELDPPVNDKADGGVSPAIDPMLQQEGPLLQQGEVPYLYKCGTVLDVEASQGQQNAAVTTEQESSTAPAGPEPQKPQNKGSTSRVTTQRAVSPADAELQQPRKRRTPNRDVSDSRLPVAKFRSQYSSAEHGIVFELRDKGLTWNEIAEHLPGRTPRSVAYYHAANVPVDLQSLATVRPTVDTEKPARKSKKSEFKATSKTQENLLRQVLEKAAAMVERPDASFNQDGPINQLRALLDVGEGQSVIDGNTMEAQIDVAALARLLARASQQDAQSADLGVHIKQEGDDDEVVFVSSHPVQVAPRFSPLADPEESNALQSESGEPPPPVQTALDQTPARREYQPWQQPATPSKVADLDAPIPTSALAMAKPAAAVSTFPSLVLATLSHSGGEDAGRSSHTVHVPQPDRTRCARKRRASAPRASPRPRKRASRGDFERCDSAVETDDPQDKSSAADSAVQAVIAGNTSVPLLEDGDCLAPLAPEDAPSSGRHATISGTQNIEEAVAPQTQPLDISPTNAAIKQSNIISPACSPTADSEDALTLHSAATAVKEVYSAALTPYSMSSSMMYFPPTASSDPVAAPSVESHMLFVGMDVKADSVRAERRAKGSV
ncbi:hypothetical protein BAUCODRAFT_35264 [Baudoinia panamericana UAMH 10762]|uniref:Myb-like domain-containing protein n=1 Tax=Baudoinia panamericana (strain UAMH 10762) TaxID=717646 RepID=M2LLT7_BAUPA|nr:uncharacterized protein BAUCODRAFT_35264 [Baudoinia panamericana UAMH 10762]EMC95277.1 hypothetical protein BAUCODRAFT_35264 [Baudoinia panamericana UAMH 10762]